MRRRLQAVLCAVTLLALGSLYLSYNRLIRSVESAATEAGLVEGDLIAA
jgi:hypothetical protein